MTASDAAGRTAHRAQHSTALRRLARGGYAVSGVLHLVLGWIVVQTAFGGSGEQANQSGALATLASEPGGRLLLWVAVVALVALAAWQALDAVMGDDTGDRLKAAGKAVVYLALGVLALRFAAGGGGGSGGQEESLTATAMQNGAGRFLVGVVGVVIVVVGVVHVVKGWTATFREDLEQPGGGAVGTAVVVLGRVGYIAKGVALGVLGGLVVAAAVTADPSKAGGLDDAFATIGSQPFGAVLLVLTGLGFAAYGVYSFARARYARM